MSSYYESGTIQHKSFKSLQSYLHRWYLLIAEEIKQIWVKLKVTTSQIMKVWIFNGKVSENHARILMLREGTPIYISNVTNSININDSGFLKVKMCRTTHNMIDFCYYCVVGCALLLCDVHISCCWTCGLLFGLENVVFALFPCGWNCWLPFSKCIGTAFGYWTA